KKVLLIIDESQLLTQEMLEEIRLLSNIERTDAKLINIFFVGQNEFNEILNQPQNRAVRQRLTLNYNLDPLTPDETCEYIKYRLKVAGTTETIFDISAEQEIFMYSGGFPRRINIICDHSLLSGYVKDKTIIDGLIVRECAKELKIPAHVRNRDINGFADNHSKPAPVIKSRAYILPPKNPEKKKKKLFLFGAIAFVSIFIFLLFFIFPNQFKNSLSMTSNSLIVLKNQIISILPDSLQQYFQHLQIEPNQAPEDPKPVTKENHSQNLSPNMIDKEAKKQGADVIVSKPIKIIKLDETIPIHPIQTNLIQAIKPEPLNSVPEKVLVPGTELIMDGDQDQSNKQGFENKNKIPLLPEDRVIVRFKYNTNDFTETGFENLKTFADILSMHPEAKILVTGYTDSEGIQKYNQKLSGFRANIVKSFLLGKGVRPDQIKIQGLGSKNPVESNDTAWGRTMNRRVEIEMLE
ncbi:MAG: OmpA family protein, partial [Desulfobacula sp.]|nr:OmpA family protein [Desulfobacula sp.]